MRYIAAFLLLCPSLVLAQAKPTAKAARPVVKAVSATVTDVKGVAAEVTDIHARYVDERDGDRRLASDDIAALVIEVQVQEGRIRASESLRYAFTDLAKLTFLENFNFEFSRRNGNVVSVTWLMKPDWTPDQQYALVERDPSGKVVRERKFQDYVLATTKQDGVVAGAAVMRRMRLSGFTGQAKMSSGHSGDFYIYRDEVRTIEFR